MTINDYINYSNNDFSVKKVQVTLSIIKMVAISRENKEKRYKIYY